ncbi:hypothetical protein B0H17DRAFT_1124616 [Mycena rosella]|uniref:Uncharacterized protein n=1 Tax=Mycena rosella TaxID=1033263 RepID=A0AAD7H089_MYCRO|nr:hypothetical protein B0H17DRAFT_1124616 [Mycena rosella]
MPKKVRASYPSTIIIITHVALAFGNTLDSFFIRLTKGYNQSFTLRIRKTHDRLAVLQLILASYVGLRLSAINHIKRERERERKKPVPRKIVVHHVTLAFEHAQLDRPVQNCQPFLVANESLTKFILVLTVHNVAAVHEVDRAQRGRKETSHVHTCVVRESFGAGAAEQVALSVLAWEESAPLPLLRVHTQLRDGAGPQMFLSPWASHSLKMGADWISSSSGVGAGGSTHRDPLRPIRFSTLHRRGCACGVVACCSSLGIRLRLLACRGIADTHHPGARMWDTPVQVVPTLPWPLRSMRVFTVGPGLTSIAHLPADTVRPQFCPRLTSRWHRAIKPSPANTKTFKRLSLGMHNPLRAWPPRSYATPDARRADAHSAVQLPQSPMGAIALSATGLNPPRVPEQRMHPERSCFRDAHDKAHADAPRVQAHTRRGCPDVCQPRTFSEEEFEEAVGLQVQLGLSEPCTLIWTFFFFFSLYPYRVPNIALTSVQHQIRGQLLPACPTLPPNTTLQKNNSTHTMEKQIYHGKTTATGDGKTNIPWKNNRKHTDKEKQPHTHGHGKTTVYRRVASRLPQMEAAHQHLIQQLDAPELQLDLNSPHLVVEEGLALDLDFKQRLLEHMLQDTLETLAWVRHGLRLIADDQAQLESTALFIHDTVHALQAKLLEFVTTVVAACTELSASIA